MNLGVYSYSHLSLNDEIAFYQKKVFDKLSIPIVQIVSGCDHSTALEKIIRDSHEEYLLFFDVDCIPLDCTVLEKITKEISPGNVLSGAMQCANHLDKTRTYVGPCFCGFSRSLYMKCGSPPLSAWSDGDVMQRFTDECVKLQKYSSVGVVFWKPTDSGDGAWDIKQYNCKFGHGTIYENVVYHQFEIRHEQQHAPFIDRCKKVLW